MSSVVNINFNTLYHVYGLTDEEGNLVEGYQYDAYGKATIFTDGDDGDSIVNFNSNDDSSNKWSSVNNPYQYTGQRYDPETGFMYYKNRYYDTNLGRFISRDPIGYEGGINLYEYATSSPVTKLDSKGTSWIDWVPVIGTIKNYLYDPEGENMIDYIICRPLSSEWDPKNEAFNEAVKRKCESCCEKLVMDYVVKYVGPGSILG